LAAAWPPGWHPQVTGIMADVVNAIAFVLENRR
jgi:hypothetical protein